MNKQEYLTLWRRIKVQYTTDLASLDRVWALSNPHEKLPKMAHIADQTRAEPPEPATKKHTATERQQSGAKVNATAIERAFDAISGTFTWKELGTLASKNGAELKKSTLSQFLRQKADSGAIEVFAQGAGRRATTYRKPENVARQTAYTK